MIHSFDYPALAADALPGGARLREDRPGLAARAPHALAHLHAARALAGFDRLEPRVGRRGAAAGRPDAIPAPSRSTRCTPSTTSSTPTCRSATRPRRAHGPRGSGAREDVRRAQLRGGLRAGRGARALGAGAARLEGGGRASSRRRRRCPGTSFAYVAGDHRTTRARSAPRAPGSPTRARAPLAQLEQIQAGLREGAGPPGPTTGPGRSKPTRLAAAAWLACAEGRKDEAAGPWRVGGRARREDRQAPRDAGLDPAPARAARRHAARDEPARGGARRVRGLAARGAEPLQQPGRVRYGRRTRLDRRPRAAELRARLVEIAAPGAGRPEVIEARRSLAAAAR